MSLALLFLHNMVDERDRCTYDGLTDTEIAAVEAIFDAPETRSWHWAIGKPRVPKKVDGGYNDFYVRHTQYGGYGFKRFTWSNYRWHDTFEALCADIEALFRDTEEGL